MDALYRQRADEVERLLAERGADSLTVHEAAALGSVTRVEQLLADDATLVNSWSPDGFQPLALACFFGRRDAAQLLLARGGEVNTHARHPFHVAPLHAALASPEPGFAAVLIAAGADVNAAQQAGSRPLHSAAFSGYVDLTRLLLEHGADPRVRDDAGQTPEAIARAHGHAELADLLARAAE